MHYFEFMKVSRLPKKYWDNDENIIHFLRFIVWKKEIKTLEDWYTKVGTRELTLCGGNGLIEKFKTFINVLNYIYKDVYEFLPWKFNRTVNFWGNIDNQKLYMTWLFKQLDYKEFSDWYRVEHKDFVKNEGIGFIGTIYNESCYLCLKTIYPEYNWLPWKFGKVPINFWKNIENHKWYINWLKEVLNYKSEKDFYKLTYDILEKNNGSGLLATCYNSSCYKMLKSLFPEYEWLPWKFIYTPDNFWMNIDNHKIYMEWLFKELNYNDISDWYKTTQEDFHSNYGSALLRYYYDSSHKSIIKTIYPEYNWLPWKFNVLPEGFWNDINNVKEYMEWLYKELGYFKMEDCYDLTRNKLEDNFAGSLFNKYDNILSILTAIYPGYKWLPWKFKVTHNGFWDNKKNQKEYMDWLFKELNYNDINDWYKISTNLIQANYGTTLLRKHYDNSLQLLIKDLYPEHKWLNWKFNQTTIGFWENINNQKEYMDWLYKELDYKSMENWYSVSLGDFYNNCGSSLTIIYKGSIKNLLKNVYSEYKWNEVKFNCYKGEMILHEYLLSLNYNINLQEKFDWCKNEETNKILPFDFTIKDLKIIIELDGKQHFEQIGNWDSPELTRKRDNIKMNKANENGYTIIRLLWDDVYYNKNEWKEKII
jgi:hypothetical protein